MISRLLLLGATGDLAGRFLFPALARLTADGRLPDDLRVLACAHDDGDDETFATHVAARLASHAGDVPDEARQALLRRLRYRRVELNDPAGLAQAVADCARRDGASVVPVAAYLALPPRLFPAALRALEGAGLPPGSRVVVEKPFGESLDSAVALDALLARVTGGPGRVSPFRVDHALGMPAVRHLHGLRSPGAAFAEVWDSRSIAQVDVLWEETLALEGRADFYDRTGAVRDVVQNHLLQVLTLVAMELPHPTTDSALHDARLAVLRAVRAPSPGDLASRTRRGRYTPGRLAGSGGDARPVRGYADEAGVDASRGTETYAELVLEVGSPRWAGTRFVLRAGKALAGHRKGVLLHLRDGVALPAAPATAGVAAADDALWLELDGAATAAAERSAYEAVLTDVLSGGSALSVSGKEAEESWRVVEPVLQGFAGGAVPLLEYAAGSPGPPRLDGVRESSLGTA